MNNTEVFDFFELHNKELENFDYAKSFYKAVLNNFKRDNDVNYLITFLKELSDIQGYDNFKKITGFEYKKLLNVNGNIQNNGQNLLDILQIFVKLKGKKQTSEATGLSIPTINNVFKNDKNITLLTLNKLLNLFNINIDYKLNFGLGL